MFGAMSNRYRLQLQLYLYNFFIFNHQKWLKLNKSQTYTFVPAGTIRFPVYKDNHFICKKNWPSIKVCFLGAPQLPFISD